MIDLRISLSGEYISAAENEPYPVVTIEQGKVRVLMLLLCSDHAQRHRYGELLTPRIDDRSGWVGGYFDIKHMVEQRLLELIPTAAVIMSVDCKGICSF